MPDDVPVADVLDELAEMLAAAPGGSREIDRRLHYGIEVMLSGRTDLAATMIREGISWPTVSAAVDDRVPPYTSSLDAALAGENVVFVIRSERRGLWGAMQRTRSGREVLVWAATEPLARRLAAVESLRADAADRAAQQPGSPAVPSGGAGDEAGSGEWKILF